MMKNSWIPPKPLKPKEQEIVRGLLTVAEADGFHLVPRHRKFFSRATATDVADFLTLQFIHYRDYTLTEMSVGKRFAAVAKLADGDRDPDGTAATIGNNVAQLYGVEVAWRFGPDDDVSELQPTIADAYRRLALPFFEHYSSSSATFDMVTADREVARRLMPLTPLINSIILIAWAASLDRHEDYERLVREGRAALKEKDHLEFDRKVKRIRASLGW